MGYDADQKAAICGPDWWCTCASGVLLLRYYPHNVFCRRSVYDYTKFLYLPLETLGLTSYDDVKFLHVFYWPTIERDGRFVATVAYAEGRELNNDKKAEDLVFHLKALRASAAPGATTFSTTPNRAPYISTPSCATSRTASSTRPSAVSRGLSRLIFPFTNLHTYC